MAETKPLIDWQNLKDNPQMEVARVCQIKTADLEDALSKHASLYAYVHASYEQARAEEGEKEWKYEKALAKAFQKLRDKGTAIGEAESTAELDSDVQEAKKTYMKAEKRRRTLWSLVKGLDHKKDMLVQLAARQRAEMQNI